MMDDLLSAGKAVDLEELQKYFGRKLAIDISNNSKIIQSLEKNKTPEDIKKLDDAYAIVKQNFADKIKYGNGIHRSFLKGIVSADGKSFDIDQIKQTIKVRPKIALKQNEKISKSGEASGNGTGLTANSKISKGYGSGGMIFFNIGIPALRGFAVNEKTDELVVVDTCPGAGSCVQYCYAMKGGYIMFPEVWKSQARILNYLLNDPVGFFKEIKTALQKEQVNAAKQGMKVALRYHDAGDFFSAAYLGFAAKLAQEMPDVDFYAYTKVGNNMIAKLPPNLILNWSEGAKSADKKIIKIAKDNGTMMKNSITIPFDMVSDVIERGNNGRPTYDENGKFNFIGDGLNTLKQRIADKFKIPVETIVTFTEMPKIPETNIPKYSVIVQSREPDDSARRRDVINTLLIWH